MTALTRSLCHVYSGFVVVWFLANLFAQDAVSLLVALDKFAWYFLLAGVPVFLLSLFTRRWKTIVFSAVPVLIIGYFYGPLIVPSQLSLNSKPDLETIRIGTYNLWNHNQDFEAVAQLVKNIDVDVLALQEITEEQKAHVVAKLSKTHPYYFVSKPIYGGTTGLFSKIKLQNIEALNFGIDRPAILADVKFDGRTMTIVSAHLNPSYWAYANQPLGRIPARFHQYIKDQNTQASMIIEALKLRNSSEASVLACDCNSQETASTNKILRQYFNEALRTMGLLTGWNAEVSNEHMDFEQNLEHIDYVWYQGRVELIGVYRAKQSAGSDHQPIVAEFGMP